MPTMEKKTRDSNTLWNNHCQTHQSQWLLNTLSELDEKIMAMITIIQKEEDSSIHRDEISPKRRQELIKMGEEFHKSYHLFAEGYDQLSYESSNNHSSSKGVIGSSVDAKPETLDILPEAIVEDLALEFQHSKLCPESPNHAIEDQEIGDSKVASITEVNNGCLGSSCRGNTGDFPMGMGYELSFQVLKLIVENQSQQAELIRRNEIKRETIKELYSQLDRVMDENKVLHDQLRYSKLCTNKNQSQFSKLKLLILGKFLGGDTP